LTSNSENPRFFRWRKLPPVFVQVPPHYFIYTISIVVILAYQIIISEDAAPLAVQYLSPMIAGVLLFWGLHLIQKFHSLKSPIPYLLFFSISIFSSLGLAKTLDGSHAETTTAVIWGVSFYTASFAYWIKRKSLTLPDVFVICNPFYLITGPVIHRYRIFLGSSLQRRLLCYVPYLTVGMFFFLVLGTQLSRFMLLIEATSLAQVLLFGVIFELFVYFNFAGASLMVYAISGIVGVSIPLNFKQPFSASNMVEFWRGWHTSLSYVLRELFYRPTRRSFGTFTAIFSVFIASAAWHGITGNFILWGLFHACVFWLSVFLLRRGWLFISTVLILPSVVIGRIIFADTNFSRLIEKFTMSSAPISIDLSEIHDEAWIGLTIALILVSIEFFRKRGELVGRRTYKHLRTPMGQLIILAMLVLFLNSGGEAIYAVYGQR
jgi:D-alanyl-lipoteichoic acid acyltransferase DltB (MBOAT superfamily)